MGSRTRSQSPERPRSACNMMQAASYRLLEAAITLNTSVELRSPLPPLRGTFAMGPDAAAYVIRTVLQSAPNQVVEVGSGVSTVLLASALRGLGRDQHPIPRSRSRIRGPDLGVPPSEPARAQGGPRSRALDRGRSRRRDAVLVRPRRACRSLRGRIRARRRSAFVGRFSREVSGRPPCWRTRWLPGALIFIDDAERESETETIRLWASRFPVTVVDRPNLERGGVLLEWSG